MAPFISAVRQTSWQSSSPKACVGFVNYYKTQFNKVCCLSLRKALCASQFAFSSGLHSISAGRTQDTTMPAKHCPASVMRPSYHETIITIETSLFACFWGRLKCDKLLTHRASNDQRNSGILYFSHGILVYKVKPRYSYD